MKLFDKYIGKAKEKKVKDISALWDEYEKWCREHHYRILGGTPGMGAFKQFLSEYDGITDLSDTKEGKKMEDGKALSFTGKYNGKPFIVEGRSQGIGIFIREK